MIPVDTDSPVARGAEEAGFDPFGLGTFFNDALGNLVDVGKNLALDAINDLDKDQDRDRQVHEAITTTPAPSPLSLGTLTAGTALAIGGLVVGLVLLLRK